ncbi:MAG: tRNA epoxyqueuosine(34) reductase QueG [Bacteroidota bacterium]
MTPTQIATWLKATAKEIGFLSVGIAKAEYMEPEARRLESWLNAGHHGQMGYMANHFDKRVDPTKLVPGAKTVVSLTYNYYTPEEQIEDAPKLSIYAYGEDYHRVVKDKLFELIHRMREHVGQVQGRCFVDSAPVLERDWARRSGIGWIGKHTLLLSKKKGSYFFLAELIIDAEIEADSPVADHCGKCTSCIDACPTDAIAEAGYVLDAQRCISYLTIELRNEIPTEFRSKMEDWMFGCDICQQVCPWNRFSVRHDEPKFEPHPETLQMDREAWEEITEETFERILGKSAVQRTTFEGIRRNISFLNSTDDPSS